MSIAEPGVPSLPGVGHTSVQNFSDSPGKPVHGAARQCLLARELAHH
jgi:hypothetical protein